jgi:hypothetical protein
MAQKIQRSVTQILRSVEEKLDEVRDEFLGSMARDLVSRSPVDTGAYVTSHSITTTSGAGRSRTSENKPRGQDTGAKQQEGLEQLYSDIAALPAGATKIYINNRSPHNKAVEFGGANWTRDGYYVYQTVQGRAKEHLDSAIAKVRSKE